MTPIVSVIVPVYNAEKYLRPCVDSIINQTLRDIEIIFVDDGSADSSLQILKKYAAEDERIKIIEQKNSGPGLARNKGIAMAKGEYISFMDADDFFESDLLESLHKKIEATNSDITFCRFWMFNQETLRDEPPEYDVSMNLLPEDEIFSAETYPEHILNLYITAVWSSMYRREFVIKNELKFSMATRVEDNLFAQTAVAMAERITFLNRKLIHYRRFFYTSLTDKVNVYWKNSFIVHKEIKDYLIAHNKYEKLKKSFLHHMLNHFRLHVIERCSEPIKSVAAFYALQYLQDEFRLGLYDIEKYTDKWTYLFYQKLYHRQNKVEILERFMEEKPQNIVPIVFAANEKFAPIMAVSIQSIIQNANKRNFYDIYVLHTDFTEEVINKFERITKGNIRITCINIKDKIFTKLYAQNDYTKEIFYRFYIPQIICEYEKVIYLDADTLVLSDIAELYQTDVKDFLLAGCVQPLIKKFQKYCIKKLNCKPENYINSGVLLFNVNKWNELKFTEKCFALIGKKRTWLAPDQNILNIACKDNIAPIDGMWNRVATINLRNKNSYITEDFEREIQNLQSARVLHYTSSLKPWKYPHSTEALIWWKYAKKSLFYEYLRRK